MSGGFLLDTNVISNFSPLKSANMPQAFAAWRGEQAQTNAIYLSAVTIHEIEKGVQLLVQKGATKQAAAIQMWLDGLYMVEPFYAAYSNMTGQAQYFDDIVFQFSLMEKVALDKKTGLLFHGWDESKMQQWANPVTGQSPEFWSRAMGWYMMGLVDVLDELPKNHIGRNTLTAILNRLTKTIIAYQDADAGVWWQITNKAGQKGNYLESSASAMFVYSIAKGIRLGYLPQSYTNTIRKAMNGLISKFVETDQNGQPHYTQAVSGAGLGGNPYRDGSYAYYISEPTRTDDLKAIGPFMQACIEADLLMNKF